MMNPDEHVSAITPCKMCRAPIRFIRTVKGKFIPVEAEPHAVQEANPKHRLVLPNGQMIRAVKAGDWGYEPHWGYCPYAKEFRKEKPDAGQAA